MADAAAAGARMAAAIRHPPSHRPTTMVEYRTGLSQVKENTPERISAPRRASPTTRQVMGRTRVCRAVPPTRAKAVAAGSSTVRDSSPNSTAPATGSRSRIRLAGTHARSV